MRPDDGSVVIAGATSEIAQACARILATKGYRLLLWGRNEEESRRMALDLKARYGAEVACKKLDALDFESHPSLWRDSLKECGNIQGMLVAFGALGAPTIDLSDFARTRETLDLNFTAVVSLACQVAPYLEERQRGWIAVIGSVAGDRGRRENFVYGSAKGAAALYLQGLRARLWRSGVKVITIKPGFVDTRMTHGLVPARLAASPESVARRIVRGLERGEDVFYVPWIWRWIMFGVRIVPERIFKRMALR